MTGMIQDLFMLAKADFTVCSYTSNVGLKRAKPKKFAQIVRKVADDKDCTTDLSDALRVAAGERGVGGSSGES